ncbi:hypothetical protein ES703_64898 [subsurface metagenome]
MLSEIGQKIIGWLAILSIIWLIYAIVKFTYFIVEGIFNYDKK